MPRPPHPVDPRVRALVEARLSRRSVLLGAAGLTALAACGTGGGAAPSGTGAASGPAKPSPAADRSDQEKVVNWANWTLYLDYDEETKKYPTLEAFQKESGLKATYAEDIDDNDTYYGKIQGQLKNGQDIGKDIIVFTDWMTGRCIRHGYAQELDAGRDAEHEEPAARAAGRRLRPGPQVQPDLAGHLRRARLEQGEGPGRPARASPTCGSPSSRAGSRCSREMRDTVGLIMLEQGVDISGPFTDDAVPGRPGRAGEAHLQTARSARSRATPTRRT